MFSHAGNTVEVPFNGSGGKDQQIFRRDKLVVSDYPKFRAGSVQPTRNMSPGYKVDCMNPRGVVFHCPEPVAQEVPVAVSAGIV